MINALFKTAIPKAGYIRQTPGNKGVWGSVLFTVDLEIEKADWVIVYDDIDKEITIKTDPTHTLLITAEPPSIKNYNQKFLSQFHYVITSHISIKHPRKTLVQQGLPWMVGMEFINGVYTPPPKLDFDALKSMKSPNKKKLMSVIVSNKKQTYGHKQRLIFVDLLKKHFGDHIDVYGGENHIPDKWDAIAPYKYHIVLENSQHQDYWTEKLADAYLGFSYPLYWGCPNLKDYFDTRSFCELDIFNPKESIKIIESVINNNLAVKHSKHILDSRNLILDKYNMFAISQEFISKHNYISSELRNVVIKPQANYLPFRQKLGNTLYKTKKLINAKLK